MKIEYNPRRHAPCVLALGMFDGVHRGHAALLAEGLELAQALGAPLTVCTFEPHPLAVLRPEARISRLTTLPERAALMARYGVDSLCVHRFTREVAALAPEDFLRRVEEIYRPLALVCGYNYTYGQFGRGNGSSLRAWGEACGLTVRVVPEVRVDGEAVSSTRVRASLEEGDVERANALLGYHWPLGGRVISGKHLGRKLGFPTANIQPPKDKLLPAFGVYLCMAQTKGGDYPAMVNIGEHPTAPGGGVTVEANLLNHDVSLYGQNVRLVFLRRLRDERRFPSLEALEEQLRLDRAEACEWFAGWGVAQSAPRAVRGKVPS